MPRQGLTRKDVLRACLQLIDEKGFAGFSMNELARRLNIRPASLYNHIENESTMLFRIAKTASERLSQALTAAVEGKTGREAFFTLADGWRAYAKQHPNLYAVAMKVAEQEETWGKPLFFTPVEQVTSGDSAARDLIIATVHGALSLELNGNFSPEEDGEQRFRRIITPIADHLWKDSTSERTPK